MNDLWILLNRAPNGVGVAVIAARDNPYAHLAAWFERKHYKDPLGAARAYEVVRRVDGCTNCDGAVVVLEHFDGDVVTGEEPPTRYD